MGDGERRLRKILREKLGSLGEGCALRHKRADIPSWLRSTPTPCLHFKLELIQTCCSWKEAMGTGSNRKMIREGIGV